MCQNILLNQKHCKTVEEFSQFEKYHSLSHKSVLSSAHVEISKQKSQGHALKVKITRKFQSVINKQNVLGKFSLCPSKSFW